MARRHLLLVNTANLLAKPQRANPRGLSVDILNDDTGDLLRSRASGQTYAVRLAHEAEANNDPRTEARKRKLFFGPC